MIAGVLDMKVKNVALLYFIQNAGYRLADDISLGSKGLARKGFHTDCDEPKIFINIVML